MRLFVIAVLAALFLNVPSAGAQNIVIPETIKKQCGDMPLENRFRVTVVRFSNSVKGVNSGNIDNFSSVLSNALFEVNCFRVLAMKKDSSDNEGGEGAEAVRPQLVITGEITEYNHKVETKKVLVKTKQTTTARVGFIIQIKNPVTRDILFSKSFNLEGSSENKSMSVTVKIKGMGEQTGGTSVTDNVDKAYFDALEKGIIDAITYIVESRDRMQEFVRLDEASKNAPKKITTILDVSNASFAKLIEIENVLKTLPTITKTEKSLKDNIGSITISHSGSIDDIISLLTSRMGNSLEITGLDGTKITAKL